MTFEPFNQLGGIYVPLTRLYNRVSKANLLSKYTYCFIHWIMSSLPLPLDKGNPSHHLAPSSPLVGADGADGEFGCPMWWIQLDISSSKNSRACITAKSSHKLPRNRKHTQLNPSRALEWNEVDSKYFVACEAPCSWFDTTNIKSQPPTKFYCHVLLLLSEGT